ncbi:PIN domain-containing protein [Streptomyces anulatus]
MIILDTEAVRRMSFDSAEARLVRVIRESKTDRVALPWMAFEERLAQYVLAYEEAHRAAMSAHRTLGRMLPNSADVAAPTLTDSARARQLWDIRLRELVDIIPTPPEAFQEALRREANRLPPANVATKHKGGARDVAIWLSAVEYARTHPEEKVYFVSGNTTDFTDGKGPYPAPMDADRDRAGANFVHLSALSDVLEPLAPPVDVDLRDVEQRLRDHSRYVQVQALLTWGGGSEGLSFPVPALQQSTGKVAPVIFATERMLPFRTKLLKVFDAKAYRLGEDTWCTAKMRWQFIGEPAEDQGLELACCTWTSHVMLSLAGESRVPQIFDPGFPEAPAGDDGIDWPEKRVKRYSIEEWAARTPNDRIDVKVVDTERHPTFASFLRDRRAHNPYMVTTPGTLRIAARLDQVRRDIELGEMATEFDDLDPEERQAAVDAMRAKAYEQFELWGGDSDEFDPEG